LEEQGWVCVVFISASLVFSHVLNLYK
jgi:hypothetical protein